MNYGERQTALDGLVSLATNHHVLAMFLIVASLLIGARSFGATYFADVNGDSQISHGGIEMAIKQWNKDYRDCSRVPSLVRGEYESREEFDARRQAHVRDCRELERLEGASDSVLWSISRP